MRRWASVRLLARLVVTTMLAGASLITRPVAAGAWDPATTPVAEQSTPLAPLAAALAWRAKAPARIVFLGSSTTYGSGASQPATSYVHQVSALLQARYPTTAPPAPVARLSASSAQTAKRGLQAFNAGIPGATAATYAGDLVVYGITRVRPACVVHMIGSNDAALGTPTEVFRANVQSAIDRIDAALGPVCHLLVHTFRRTKVPEGTWAEYGAALAGIAASRSWVHVADASAAFAAADAAGSDPHDLVGPDQIHLSDAGHLLMARLVDDALEAGMGSWQQRRLLDTDSDGLRDVVEVRGSLQRQRVRPCHGLAKPQRSAKPHRRVATSPLAADTDEDGLSDGVEVGGLRIRQRVFVPRPGRSIRIGWTRTDPSNADSDGDGLGDNDEALGTTGAVWGRRTDPTRCDTDRGGISDGAEVRRGTDPTASGVGG